MKRTVLWSTVFGLLFLIPPTFAATLEEVIRDASPEQTVIRVRLSEPVEPVMRFVPTDFCWQIDLPGVTGDAVQPRREKVVGPLRLLWGSSIHQDPPIYRLRLFVKTTAPVKLARLPEGFLVLIRESGDDDAAPRPRVAGRKSQPLLQPSWNPPEVRITVDNVPALAILQDLAHRGGITLHLPHRFSRRLIADVKAASPREALELLLDRMGMRVTRKGQEWWVSGPSDDSPGRSAPSMAPAVDTPPPGDTPTRANTRSGRGRA